MNATDSDSILTFTENPDLQFGGAHEWLRISVDGWVMSATWPTLALGIAIGFIVGWCTFAAVVCLRSVLATATAAKNEVV